MYVLLSKFISLVLEDHVIPAHKSVLSSRCTYFQGMFRSFMPPDNTVNVSTFTFCNFNENNYLMLNAPPCTTLN